MNREAGNDPREGDKPRARYEAPTVVDLGALTRGHGNCNSGSAVFGSCSTGYSPTGACRGGSQPGGTCNAGTGA